MVDGPLVAAGAGGRAQHHAISLRKVGVLIGVRGSTVTYQKHLCSSRHFSGSKNDPECTALYSEHRPPAAAASGTSASQTPKPRRIALCYSIPGLSRRFFWQFFSSSRWTYQCVYTDGEETEGSLSGRLIVIILPRKKKKGEAYLQLSQWTNKIPQLQDEG